MDKQEIICIGCPLGCRAAITIDRNGEVTQVTGNKCKKGRKYAVDEFKSPIRVLTATVLIENSDRALLPVRTTKPIRKDLLAKCMVVLSSTKVKPPVNVGEVIVPDVLGTGADIVSTDELTA